MISLFRSWIKPIWALWSTWLRDNSLPGFNGVSIWNVGEFLIHEVRKDDPFMRANAVAFSFFLSLFPAIITLFTLLPYLPIYELFSVTLQDTVRGIMPGTAGDWLVSFLNDIATRERRGLLSFSTLLALYFSTSGTATLMYSFEKDMPQIFKNRNPIMKRWIALWLTVILAVLVVVSIGLVIAGHLVVGFLTQNVHADWVTTVSFEMLRWILVISLFYSSISLLYRYGAPTKTRFHFFSTGATVATILALLSSILFSMYINAFGTYNKLYGSIGTIIAMMLWLQINAFVIISGYELNTAILFHRITRKDIHPPVAPDSPEDDPSLHR
ncbi:MAG: YihY/virulence factor BrkB family protein [Saprospiraceae bacterium]|nr:YihY/virulence factor BrkB family protein [Saprospiraceae bacterium]